MNIANTVKYLCVIAGPTAAGKTDLAIRVAQHFRTEIISADSRQIYKEMEAGTARPDEGQLAAVKHHMIAEKSIDTLYGAGDFARDAMILLDTLFREHNLVVLAGGSGLYIDALLHGFHEFETVPQTVRDRLNEQFRKEGLAWLQHRVRQADPEFYSEADVNNPQRLIRALEVFEHTGKPFSSLRQKPFSVTRGFNAIKLLINPPRQELYTRINRRVDEMMRRGLLEEATELYPHRHHNALRTVGYKELFDYIEGKYSLEQATDKIKQHTRNYAKRQLTWFRNRDHYTEFRPEQENEIIEYIRSRMAETSSPAGRTD